MFVQAVGGRARDSIQREAARISAGATPNQRTMAHVIYGETGGTDFEDALLVGWTLRNRYERAGGRRSYEALAGGDQFAPLPRLRAPTPAELNAWRFSFDIAAEVLNASPASNPIPGIYNFYSPARMKPPFSEPSWAIGKPQFPSASDRFIFIEGVP